MNLFKFYFLIKRYNSIFDQNYPDGNSCAWFLHARPEDSTLVLGRGIDEMDLIQEVSKNLPLGDTLYIKENALMLGVRKHGFYKKLRQFGNVRLLSPTASNSKILSGCDRVVGVSGTILLEAKLLNKEVFSMGDPEFLGVLDNNKYSTIRSFLNLQSDASDGDVGIEILRYVQWVFESSSKNHVAFLADLSSPKATNCILDLGKRLEILLENYFSDEK